MYHDAPSESRTDLATICDPSIGDVVASTLADRFSEIHHRLAELLKPESNQMEAVHQLRVATRRAEASIYFFRVIVDKSLYRRAVKRLKELRSHLGELRDLDVLLEQICDHSSQAAQCLIGIIRQDYDDVMHKTKFLVRSIDSNLPLEDEKSGTPIRPSAGKLAKQPFKAWTVQRIEQIAERFLSSLRLNDFTAKSLHRLRIRGKKLRYSLEIFEDLVPDVVESPFYRRLVKLQTNLGKIQDGVVQRRIFARLTEQTDRRDVRNFIKDEARRRKRQRSQLLHRLKQLRSKRHRKAYAEELESLLNLFR
jgi:CHAD domain-containing protein